MGLARSDTVRGEVCVFFSVCVTVLRCRISADFFAGFVLIFMGIILSAAARLDYGKKTTESGEIQKAPVDANQARQKSSKNTHDGATGQPGI